MYLVAQLFCKRLFILFSLVLIGGSASMAKSFDLYGNSVRELEVSLGGAWVLHAVVATTLGFIAAWSTPKLYYQCGRFALSPWVLGLLVMVALDELLQMLSPLREFSMVDLGINLVCVTFGALVYVRYLKSPLGDRLVYRR